MTSEVEALKTNEFLRRSKLRIQQVREQSKDIAKKIRQRASAERIRSLVDLDSEKGKHYLEQQDKFVQKLEQLYAKSLDNVGAGHKKAAEVSILEDASDKTKRPDLTKQRARVAAAELRRERQEKLDNRKKSLDRKLIAREIANEISRDKSGVVANKFSKVSSIKPSEETVQAEKPNTIPEQTSTSDLNNATDKVINDMATQWEGALPNEWEPHIPVLSLPKDDSAKECSPKHTESKSERTKRPNLFALSDEMPSSLRGGLASVDEEAASIKPSLTLVSDYIQNRDLRLREPDIVPKKHNEDLQNIKQTILRSRASAAAGTLYDPVCHVADVQVIPVPSWEAEPSCGFCTRNHYVNKHLKSMESHQFKTITNSQINRIFSSIRPLQHDIVPSPVLRGSSPFKRSKVCPGTFSTKSSNFEKSSKVSQQIPQEKIINRKGLVTTYNHSTRDLRDVHCGKKNLVIRDSLTEDDAYSQAMKESSNENVSKEKEHQKKLQEMRHKIAMTKQNVDKEYKDTMAFLKSLPKDTSKPIRNAYKDNHQQQMQKERRQRRMQNEFKKIQKEMHKHSYDKSSKVSTSMNKSPVTVESDDDFKSRDIQYSWMPVPESDGNLAIHTIPTTLKQEKSGNNVKFSKIDSYHEYRSRHKHTPPTKDTAQDKQKENFISEHSDDTDSSSTSDTSSIENLRLHESKGKSKSHNDGKLSDAERIIVYKILDTKAEKKAKCSKHSKAIQDIAKSLSLMTKERLPRHMEENDENDNPMGSMQSSKHADTRVSFEQLKEGIYKTTSDKRDNLASAFFTNDHIEQGRTQDELCDLTNPSGRNILLRKRDDEEEINKINEGRQPSASTSTSSFKTATNDKATSLTENDFKQPNEVAGTSNKFIQFTNKSGQESGKLYIGATGLLKDDAYEVVIQLRKKDGTQVDSNELNNVEDKATNVEIASGVQEPIQESKTTAKVSREHDRRVQTPHLADPTSEFVKESQILNNVEEKMIKNTEFTDVPPKTTRTEINSQGVGTSNQDYYAIPSAYSKGISEMKSANSVSTQTATPVSPQRHTYSHMSSSTSTAYLSPPEFILPPFLRNNRRMDSISDEISESRENNKIRNNDCCEHCKNCVHGRCGRRNCSPCKMKVTSHGQFTVPPNTARSGHTSEYNAPELYKTCRKKLTSVNLFPKTNKKCTKYDRDLKKCSKSQYKTSRPINSSNRGVSTRNNVLKLKNLGQHYSSKYKYHEFRISPLLKCYVDKLLKLNKESLTAIDVANQECSSVSTPGSSIIDRSHNIDNNKPRVRPQISLEQIKENVTQQLLDQYIRNYNDFENNGNVKETENRMFKKTVPRSYKKKPLHKVKSLNISRKLVHSNCKKIENPTKTQSLSQGSSTSSRTDDYINSMPSVPSKTKIRSKSSPSPRRIISNKLPHKNHSSDYLYTKNSDDPDKITSKNLVHPQPRDQQCHKSIATHSDRDCVNAPVKQKQRSIISPLTTSTQTSQHVIDEEISYIKLAESKLQNMEKIADLTEKCTQRLSNLAKVLDEVRRNKTTAYSQVQVSDTASVSDTERTSLKNSETQIASSVTYEPIIELREKDTSLPQTDTLVSPLSDSHYEATGTKPSEFEPFLKDIPKPKKIRSLDSPEKCINLIESPVHLNSAAENYNLRTRSKPPPAMSHKCFKRVPEMMVPHELSTVIEVDSPLSAKTKGQSGRDQSKAKHELPKLSITEEEGVEVAEEKNKSDETKNNPDLVQSNANLSRRQKILSTDSSDETKMQMIDLNKFNEIMLKPFISIQEYAKQCNNANIEEPSNIDNVTKGDANEELSSLHSDGSLPDVIAELLKRNIIKEPFKFDTASVNSTTASSESTFSVTLSNSKEKKKSREIISNKENIAETSDSMSISSNPDLENAFKKLGMGWASSTLKRTKERLALSSSSNTSSSSLSQYKSKPVHNQDFPVLVADSLSKPNAPAVLDSTKDVEQQTSKINSMTVKQFLTKELAKKITFSNKSRRDDTENEFISLYETKMPDDMKLASKSRLEDRSIDSNNRARTSTPVQIFKSMTYHSSSSSNVSNGLFSNADDLSSVKGTSNSIRNHSTSDKDDLTIPNISLRIRKGLSDNSKSS